MNKPLFQLGRIVATPGALEALSEAEQIPITFLQRHQSGDWGDCGAEDKQENVITEADRSSTCVLLPEEY